MENTKFDRKKVIEEMQALKDKKMSELKRDITARGQIEFDEKGLSELITIKYLGKIELVNEQGELIEKDWYAVIEQHSGQFQITYYDENQQFLGFQRGIEEEIVPSKHLMWEKPEKMKELKQENIEEAKTLEELQEEQEPPQLPGVEEEPQLTKTQVDRMNGPKTSLNQIVDEATLGNIIGLDGQYMQIVDVDTVREYIPDLQIPSSQRTIPIEIFPDGTANIIGEDKLEFSAQEGMNSMEAHVTATNEGLIQNEENLETYNIASRGGMHTIAVGYDENGGMPLEMKYGWRDIEEPSKITYSELETVHEGPISQDDSTNEYKQDASQGIDKAKTISREDAERYAKAKGLYEYDCCGNAIGYDIDTATKEISEDGRSVDKIIDDLDVKTRGPQEGPKPHYQ